LEHRDKKDLRALREKLDSKVLQDHRVLRVMLV